MKIAYCSDVHLEFGNLDLENTEQAEVLILAGDIMIAQDLHDHAGEVNPQLNQPLGARQQAALLYRDFLRRASEAFPYVIYVAGNHEFYHGRWTGSINHLREECAKFDNVHFLERDTKIINDVVFVGATLWTDCNRGDPLTLHSLTGLMSDYRFIRDDDNGYTKLRPARSMHRHQQSLGYIKTVVEQNRDQKIVVVSHHAPSRLSIHEHYKDAQLMNGAFASDLSEFILDHPEILVWCHGHMHNPSDYQIGDTRILCNPRGYIGHEPFAHDFVLKYFEV